MLWGSCEGLGMWLVYYSHHPHKHAARYLQTVALIVPRPILCMFYLSVEDWDVGRKEGRWFSLNKPKIFREHFVSIQLVYPWVWWLVVSNLRRMFRHSAHGKWLLGLDTLCFCFFPIPLCSPVMPIVLLKLTCTCSEQSPTCNYNVLMGRRVWG